MSKAGHYQGNITLDIVREVLHEGDKARPGCYMYTAVHLEVKEVRALKYMVFIPKGATGTEAAGPIRSRNVGMAAKFDVKAVVDNGSGGLVGGGSVG